MTTRSTTTSDRWRGALYGLAYGDAWGWPVEFTTYAQLVRTVGLKGPDFPTTAVITDDTQMALALADALAETGTADLDQTRHSIADHFLRWRIDPDNTRAPGTTCMSALGRLADLDAEPTTWPWESATDTTSCGCGAVMRVAPAAFLTSEPATIAVAQAALTHGHPAAPVSAWILGEIIYQAATDGLRPGRFTAAATDIAAQATVTSGRAPEWDTALGHVPTLAGAATTADYVLHGAAISEATLSRAAEAVPQSAANPWGTDPCAVTGDGWTSHEAIAAAMLCCDLFPDDPVQVLRRAATTNGDSDSIACIAGALVGASYGDIWPPEWQERLEPRYRRWLAQAANYPVSL